MGSYRGGAAFASCVTEEAASLPRMLALFPRTARVDDGVLSVGGASTVELAERFGTPLVVYCEQTLRERAQLFLRAAPGAFVAYGTKAFANVALLRLLGEEGLGADVSTLGELAFARAAGLSGDRLVVHGNNKSDEELEAAAELGALVVLDAPDEPERAAEAGVRRVLVRVTPGVKAETHEAIRTGHRGSKFGLDADDALESIRRARAAGLAVEGIHVHVGSQLADPRAHLLAVSLLAAFADRCRTELDWTPEVVDVGGGFGIRHVLEEPEPPVEELVRTIAGAVARDWVMRGLPAPRLIFEPGRSLVGPAACTLYRVGAVKRAGDRAYAAIDGGMSDNPRPQLYRARYAALLANRAAEEPDEIYSIAGKHCESGDVLIERAPLPEPRRGDLLAVPATGAYTLAMSSTYNGVPRPAVVLVRDGEARLILRRETVEDLLVREA
jgi:diaminopimelate decarboxylase